MNCLNERVGEKMTLKKYVDVIIFVFFSQCLVVDYLLVATRDISDLEVVVLMAELSMWRCISELNVS